MYTRFQIIQFHVSFSIFISGGTFVSGKLNKTCTINEINRKDIFTVNCNTKYK